MSSGVFRGKESSNRIELSQLVLDLLNFGVLGSLQLLGRGWMGGGIWGHGSVPRHGHTHVHTCTHMYTCIEIENGCPHGGIHVYHVYNMHVYACLHVCVCMHACACVHGASPTHPHPPPCPWRDTLNQ